MKKLKILLLTLLSLICFASYSNAEYFSDVVITGTSGIWTDSRSYSTLGAALAAIGTDQRTLVIAQQVTCTTATIHANTTLKFLRNGSIANSGQLTINTKNIEAGDYQIFTGAGDIDFADGSLIRSAWFSDINEAIDVTADDTITLLITAPDTTTASSAVGNNVTLAWDSPGNIITAAAGHTISNIHSITAGDYQILGGDGDFDFVNYPWLNVRWFDSFRTAVDYIGTDEATLAISGEAVVDLDTTIQTTLTVSLVGTGYFNISATKTLIIDGTLVSGIRQIFDGAGDVVFGATSNGTIHPEWWGIDPTGTLDAAIPINKAIESMESRGGGTIEVSDGYYFLDSSVLIEYGGVEIDAPGMGAYFYRTGDYGSTILARSALAGGISTRQYGLVIRNLMLRQLTTPSTSSSPAHIQVDSFASVHLENLRLDGGYRNILLQGCDVVTIADCFTDSSSAMGSSPDSDSGHIDLQESTTDPTGHRANVWVTIDNHYAHDDYGDSDHYTYCVRIDSIDSLFVTNSHFGYGNYSEIIYEPTSSVHNAGPSYFTNCYFDQTNSPNSCNVVFKNESSTGVAFHANFTNCWFRDPVGAAIYFESECNAHDIVIDGCQISNVLATSDYGIYVASPDIQRVSITGNLFLSILNYNAIKFVDGSDYFNIVGNGIYGVCGSYQIDVGTGCTNFIVTSNSSTNDSINSVNRIIDTGDYAERALAYNGTIGAYWRYDYDAVTPITVQGFSGNYQWRDLAYNLMMILTDDGTTGSLQITNDLIVDDDATISGDEYVLGLLSVTGNISSQANVSAAQDVIAYDDLQCSDDLVVGDDATIYGDCTISGTLAKGAGAFKITHPIDDSMWLYHSFIEGPRADLIYRGIVELTNGEALVSIDEASNMIAGTFAALTKNPQVFLQNVDGWTPIRGHVDNGFLYIEAKDIVDETISWLVIAERNDQEIRDSYLTDDDGNFITETMKKQLWTINSDRF